MRFALINDNQIKKIEDMDESDAMAQISAFQQIICIDDISPEPQVGWIFNNGDMYEYLPALSPRQMRIALILSGVMLTDIDSALNTLPEPTRSMAMVAWEYAISFERRDPLVASVAAPLGWDSSQVDALWRLGGTL